MSAYRAAAVALALACNSPRATLPLERLIVIGYRGDTLMKLDGFDCYAGRSMGAISTRDDVRQEMHYTDRIAVAMCVADPTPRVSP